MSYIKHKYIQTMNIIYTIKVLSTPAEILIFHKPCIQR